MDPYKELESHHVIITDILATGLPFVDMHRDYPFAVIITNDRTQQKRTIQHFETKRKAEEFFLEVAENLHDVYKWDSGTHFVELKEQVSSE